MTKCSDCSNHQLHACTLWCLSRVLQFLYRENMNKNNVHLHQKTNKTLNDNYQKQNMFKNCNYVYNDIYMYIFQIFI